ncbi:MAG: glycosyltransferase, partial [Thermoplasmata archaeon]
GSWILAALKEAEGPILVFLDDDDLFDPAKLATVLRMFQSTPELGYYHNGLRYVEEGGKTSLRTEGPAEADRPAESIFRLSSGSRAPRGIAEAWGRGAAFNLSSISVRREVIDEQAAALGDIRGGVGSFLFYAAVLSSCEIVVDPTVLTNYRIHAGNKSGSGTPQASTMWVKQARFVRDGIHDTEVVLGLLRARGIDPRSARPLRIVLHRSQVLLAAVDPSIPRTWTLTQIVRLAMASFPDQMRSGWGYFVMGILRMASPTWSRRWLGMRERSG